MGRTATYRRAIVKSGCRIELDAPPGLQEGDELDVLLLTRASATSATPARPIVEILDSLPAGIGMFASAQDADAYVRKERESWET